MLHIGKTEIRDYLNVLYTYCKNREKRAITPTVGKALNTLFGTVTWELGNIAITIGLHRNFLKQHLQLMKIRVRL